MPAQVFGGRYRIERHVARGGMAEVYAAHDEMLDRPVALKVLFPELSADHSFVERFRREARAAAGLNHPNIVSVYDWGEEDGTYFIVMEYVEGRTLREIIHTEGPLLADRAADITAEIAAALHFAHTNGVIHRDVKPGNVIISPAGMVKVTDFGIARAGDPQESLTQTGAVMGTATYFSPEQAQGVGIDPRSDVYSLGVVLYEMLTGRPPFTGDNPVAIAYQHVRESPTPPRQLNADVPAAVEAIAMKAMAKNPANRYQSADDLRADLVRFRQGRAVTAEPVLGALPPDATVVAPVTRVDDGTRVLRGAAPPPPRPRQRTGAYIVLLLLLLALLGVLLFLLAGQLDLGGSGGKQVATPNLLGLSQADATRAVTDAHLKPDIKTGNSDTVQAGQVFDQNPKPGAKADRGSTVTIFISAGAAEVTVPDVQGLNIDDALTQLDNAGFHVSVQRQSDDAVAADRVISQSLPPNSKAAKGATVNLLVSSGPTATTAPSTTTEASTTSSTSATTTTSSPTTSLPVSTTVSTLSGRRSRP